jgi:hypothetical protein
MGDHSGDADNVEGITWPGFVDIMASVIMMFIFFVLITAVALYFHTITYKSKIFAEVEDMAKKRANEVTKEIQQDKTEAEQKIEEIIAENKELEAKITEYELKLEKTESKFAISKEQKITIDDASNTIVLFFGKDSISLTEESVVKLNEFIADVLSKAKPEKITVNIEGSKNPNAITESAAREIAVARMMNARNVFLQTAIPRNKIVASFANDKKIEDNYNWVKIRLDIK